MPKNITHGWSTALPDNPDYDVSADELNDHAEVYSGLTAGQVLRASAAAAADFAALQDADIPATIARDAEVTAAIGALSTVYQPLDSDLTAIAALTTTPYGRALLALADAVALRTAAGVVIGTDVPALSVFNDHSARHEDAGGDEISIAGLAGTPLDLTAHLTDAAAAHAASAISLADAAGGFAATDAEAAFAELRAERVTINAQQDYGVTFDGVTDDTAAMAAALAAVPAAGGKIICPGGDGVEARITSSLTLPDYVTIEGVGARATVFRWDGAAATHMFDGTGAGSGRLVNLYIAGPVAAAGARTGYGLLLDSMFGWVFQGVDFQYLERALTFQNNAGDNNFFGCWARDCDVGAMVNSTVNYWFGGGFANCVTGITNSAHGGLQTVLATFAGIDALYNIDLATSGEFSFDRCWFEHSQTAIARLGNGLAGPSGTSFTACHLHTDGVNNIHLRAGCGRTKVALCDFFGPRVVLIDSGHTRSIFIANGSDSGGDYTITDNNGDAMVWAIGSTAFLDVGEGTLRGGTAALPMILASKMTAGGGGMVFRAKNNVGADADFMYALANVGTPTLVVPGNLVSQGLLEHSGAAAGFFGTTPINKPTATGSRGGNAALASLLTALVNLGLIIDSTTA